nr:response regulator transcription factor [uncultured Arsenicibacter sp.]
MKTLNVLVVEDELLTQEVIADTLREGGHSIIGLARNYTEAVAIAKNQTIDLAILDVTLNGSSGDGISIAHELQRTHNLDVLFITAHTEEQTLARIKQTHPVTYISKPFQKIDLKMQLELISQKKEDKLNRTDSILIRDGDNLVKIRLAHVVYAEAAGNYTCVYVLNRKKPFTITDNLQNIKQKYFPDLFRISRSNLVNLDFLETLGKDSITLQLNDAYTPELKTLKISGEARNEILKRIPRTGSR